MPRIDDQTDCLLIVDVQNDFCPGGALAVPDGDAVVPVINALGVRFAHRLLTQDWHPAGHLSFASSHAGKSPFATTTLAYGEQVLWPDHCVQNTPGSELHDALPWAKVDAIIRKGTDPAVDSYSGFRNNWNADGQRPSTGLAGLFRERGMRRIYACGLARDYCVSWSALDAADLGFESYFIWDLTRPVDPQSDETVAGQLRECGVRIIESSEL